MAHGKDKGSTNPSAEMTSRGHRYDPYGSIQRHQRAVSRRQRAKENEAAQLRSERGKGDTRAEAEMALPHKRTFKFDTKFVTDIK